MDITQNFLVTNIIAIHYHREDAFQKLIQSRHQQ